MPPSARGPEFDDKFLAENLIKGILKVYLELRETKGNASVLRALGSKWVRGGRAADGEGCHGGTVLFCLFLKFAFIYQVSSICMKAVKCTHPMNNSFS